MTRQGSGTGKVYGGKRSESKATDSCAVDLGVGDGDVEVDEDA